MSAVHFSPGANGERLCGAKVLTVDSDGGETDDRADVDCKRCLASLVKRDRRFRLKARSFILERQRRHVIVWFHNPEARMRLEATEAIALEEGKP